jgi:hypothetical protein
MYGDRILLYNWRTGEYFAGFDKYRVKRDGEHIPKWTFDRRCAWSTIMLDRAKENRGMLGADMKILTETQARRIEEMRALDEEYRAAKGKPSLLFAQR